MKNASTLLRFWTCLVLVFLYLPVVLLIVYSFNASRLNIRWGGLSLSWYQQLLHEHDLIDATLHSLVIAGIVTLLSVPLGTITAWALHRYRPRFSGAVNGLALLPIIMPDIIIGVSLLLLFATFSQLGNKLLGRDWLGLGFVTVILSHVTFCFPFVMVTVRARLAGLDPSLEEAAQDLGATPIVAFRRIILPYLSPAIISGGLLAFTLSMDELIITFFTSGPQSVTLPVKAFGMARVGMNPSLNAVSAVLILITSLLMGVADLFRRRASIR